MRKTLRQILHSADEEQTREWLANASAEEIERAVQESSPAERLHQLARDEDDRRRAALLPAAPHWSTVPNFWLSAVAAGSGCLALVVAGISLSLQLRHPAALASSPPPVPRVPAVPAPTPAPESPPAAPRPPAAPGPDDAVAPAAPTSSPPEDFAAQVRASQERAVARHPDLAQARSVLNLRFVNAYQRLKLQQSSRLDEPDWPEKLAAECSAELAGDSPLPGR